MATFHHANGTATIDGHEVVIHYSGGAVRCPISETELVLRGGVVDIHRLGQFWIELKLPEPRMGFTDFIGEWDRAKRAHGTAPRRPSVPPPSPKRPPATALEATYIVRAQGATVYLWGDLVAVDDTDWLTRLFGAKPKVAPIADATAHLFGRTLRLHQNGVPWLEVQGVEDPGVAHDFIDELRRLRWLARGESSTSG